MTRVAPGGGLGRLVWSRLRRDRAAVAAVVVIGLAVLLALGAPVIAHLSGHPMDEPFRESGLSETGLPTGPSRRFWLGTDELGRDVGVRIAYGARVSLLVGVAASLLSAAIGLVVGLAAGYLGGVADMLLSRFTDLLLSVPVLLVAVALVAVTGPSPALVVLVMVAWGWPIVSRVVRSQTVAVRELGFVEAARSLGAGPGRVMFRQILPNILAPVIVYAALLVPQAILFEATLSFLGLGVQPPTPTWGAMLAESAQYYRVGWWLIVFPGAALFVTALAFNVLADSLRDALDPVGLAGRGRALQWFAS